MKSKNEIADRVLVIAYGNPLRCDDGVAWQAAEEIRRKLPSLVELICVHQLTPELVEEISRVGTVIFLDATHNVDPGTVVCQPISAECTIARFSHHLAPAQLLSLCDQLYEAKPRGFLISIGGQRFDHGEGLSPVAINALPQSVAAVDGILRRLKVSHGLCEPELAMLRGSAATRKLIKRA
jgi:hydrogenase maturation protease